MSALYVPAQGYLPPQSVVPPATLQTPETVPSSPPLSPPTACPLSPSWCSTPTVKRGSVMNIALDRTTMLQVVEKSRTEAALAFTKSIRHMGRASQMGCPRVRTSSRRQNSGSPWMVSMHESNPCSPWGSSAQRCERSCAPVGASSPCSPASSYVGASTPTRLSVRFIDGMHCVQVYSPGPMSPGHNVMSPEPLSPSSRSLRAAGPFSPTTPKSTGTQSTSCTPTSDDSEPPISKSQPLGRCPLGLVGARRVAAPVLPPIPARILGKLRRPSQDRSATVPRQDGAAAVSVAQTAGAPSVQSSVEPPTAQPAAAQPASAQPCSAPLVSGAYPAVTPAVQPVPVVAPEPAEEAAVAPALLRLRAAQQKRRELVAKS